MTPIAKGWTSQLTKRRTVPETKKTQCGRGKRKRLMRKHGMRAAAIGMQNQSNARKRIWRKPMRSLRIGYQ
jgi:hypothetical protein